MSTIIEAPKTITPRRTPQLLTCDCGTQYPLSQPGCSLEYCAECRIEHEAIAWSIRDIDLGLIPQVYDSCACGLPAVSWSDPVHQDGPLCEIHLVDRLGPAARLN